MFGGCDRDEPTEPNDSLSLWKSVSNPQIVFMSRADHPAGELYRINKAGDIYRLTENDRHENNPAISADGLHVTFHAGQEDNPLTWDIFRLEIATGREVRLTDNDVLDGHPDWSPDASRIVFASYRDSAGNPSGTPDLYVIDTGGTGLSRLTTSPLEENDPEWSPAGDKIVFKATWNTMQPAREEIFVMNADGTQVSRLTTVSGWQSDHDPSWSPDGEAIVFTRFEGTRPWTDLTDPDTLRIHWEDLTPWNVFQVGLNGGPALKLTDDQDLSGLPVYSNDGQWIAYVDQDIIFADSLPVGTFRRLTVVDSSGGESQRLVPSGRHIYSLEYFDW
jgi:Tol biopolymer transport system component